MTCVIQSVGAVVAPVVVVVVAPVVESVLVPPIAIGGMSPETLTDADDACTLTPPSKSERTASWSAFALGALTCDSRFVGKTSCTAGAGVAIDITVGRDCFPESL